MIDSFALMKKVLWLALALGLGFGSIAYAGRNVYTRVAADASAISPPADTALPSGDYYIDQYGAIGDGQTLNTHAIQAAVDDCHRHGGGTIWVPHGRWVTGTIRLYSNMKLYLYQGAVLIGSPDTSVYGHQADYGFSGPGAGTRTGILVAHGEHDITIGGDGTIDGNGPSSMYMDSLQQGQDLSAKYTRQGKDYMDPKWGRADGPVAWKGSYENRPGVMAIFSSCRNVTLDHVRFVSSPNWTIAFLNCEDIGVYNITIDNNMNIPNSDGIDMYDSHVVHIMDCNIHAGDDAIAVIGSNNVSVFNCELHSRSSGIRVGYNVFTDKDSWGLFFDKISIFDSNRGIGIFQRRKGNMKSMIFSNMVIHTRLHSGQWWGHGEPIHISVIPGLGSHETGSISQIKFSHIQAVSESGIVVYAAAKGDIRDVTFEDIDLSIRNSPLEAGYGGNFDLRPTNDLAFGIFEHDIPALFAKNVQGLTVKDLHVEWDKDLPAYFDHAIETENVEGLMVSGLQESPVSKGMISIPEGTLQQPRR